MQSCPCPAPSDDLIHTYLAKPPGEASYGLEPYARTLHRCVHCDHVWSVCDLVAENQEVIYREAFYGPDIDETFTHMMGLALHESDNRQRVLRVIKGTRWASGIRVLDLGGGLGVFAAAMGTMAPGFPVTYVDSDPVCCDAAHRLRKAPHVVCDDWQHSPTRDIGRFDLVTLNGVLARAANPVSVLQCIAHHRMVLGAGLVYLEVPHVEASERGYDGPEFRIEHRHVWSVASLAMTLKEGHLRARNIEAVTEPSGKRTLVAWAA
jgi:hypothetical protein